MFWQHHQILQRLLTEDSPVYQDAILMSNTEQTRGDFVTDGTWQTTAPAHLQDVGGGRFVTDYLKFLLTGFGPMTWRLRGEQLWQHGETAEAKAPLLSVDSCVRPNTTLPTNKPSLKAFPRSGLQGLTLCCKRWDIIYDLPGKFNTAKNKKASTRLYNDFPAYTSYRFLDENRCL